MKTFSPFNRNKKNLHQQGGQGALWYTKLERGLAEDEVEGFQQALDEDEMLLSEIDAFSNTIKRIQRLPAEDALSLKSERKDSSAKIIRFPSVWIGVAAVLTLFVGGIVTFQKYSSNIEDPLYYSENIEASSSAFTHILPDQSLLRVHENTELQVEYASTQRAITLKKGEAYFDVQPDAARPFIVNVDGFEIRAIGTAFNVDVSTNIGVVVTEGKVSLSIPQESIATNEHADDLPLIHEGQTLLVDPTLSADSKTNGIEVRCSTPQEVKNALSWKPSLLDYNGSSLLEIEAHFEIKTGYRLVIADPQLNDFVLGGVLPSHDVDRFIEVLEKGYDIPVEKKDRIIIVGVDRK